MSIFESPFFQRIFTLKHLRQKVQEQNISTLGVIILVCSLILFLSYDSFFHHNFDVSIPPILTTYQKILNLIGLGVSIFVAKIGFKLVNKPFSWKIFFMLSYAIYWRILLITIILTSIPLLVLPGAFKIIAETPPITGVILVARMVPSAFTILLFPLAIFYLYSSNKEQNNQEDKKSS